jgi:hypothetical protein
LGRRAQRRELSVPQVRLLDAGDDCAIVPEVPGSHAPKTGPTRTTSGTRDVGLHPMARLRRGNQHRSTRDRDERGLGGDFRASSPGCFLERMHRSGPTESVNGGASSAALRCPSSSGCLTSSETVRGSAMLIIRKKNGPRHSSIWSSRSDAMYVMTRRNTSLAGRPATARHRLSRSHSSHTP